MLKKIFSVIMVLALTVTAAPLIGMPTAFAENWEDVLYYGTNGDGTGIIITGCYYEASGNLVIPSEIDGLPIFGIGDGAFSNCPFLTGVTIPDSVKSIGNDAFSLCESLTSITIPDSVTSIGERAFYNCYSLTSVTITDSVTGIGNEVFCSCSSLTAVTIPDSVTSIGMFAFSGCTELTGITIPDSVTSIGARAFEYCYSFTNVTIGSGLDTIDDFAFSDCYKLLEVRNLSALPIIAGSSDYGGIAYYAKNVYSDTSGSTILCETDDGFIFMRYNINDYLISYKGTKTDISLPESYIYKGGTVSSYALYEYAFYARPLLKGVTVPDSVTSIGQCAFHSCLSLASVTLGNNVTSIGSDAFSLCGSLKSIAIPDSVTSIEENTFYRCFNLKNVTIGNGVTSIGDFAFFCCLKLTDITIGSGVMRIGNAVFEGCSSLIGVILPDSVTSIGYRTFAGCTLLRSVTIPDGLTILEYGMFRDCISLLSIIIPDSVTSIRDTVFFNCSSLASVTIGNSVTSIGHGAFCYCSSLTSITIPRSVTEFESNVFDFDSGAFFLRCFENSAAEQYAIDNGIPYTLLVWFKLSAQSVYSIDGGLNRFYTGIGTNRAAAILSDFENTNIVLYKDGKPLEGNAVIGTGYKVCLMDGGNILDTLTAVVKGDLNGDGAVDALDAFLANSALNNHSSLSGIYFEAANIDTANMDFDICDYAALMNLSVGITELSKLELKQTSPLQIDTEKGFLKGVAVKQTAADVLENFQKGDIVIYKNGLPLSSLDTVGTGCVIKMMNAGIVTEEITVAVKGDISGDGVIDALDAFLANSAVNGHLSLEGAYLDAADIDKTTEGVDISDFSMILNYATDKAGS